MPWQPYHAVWALLVFGWICNYVVRMAFSPLLEPVMAEFGLTHAQGGFLFSVFFYGYIAMQVPAGLLGDRFGRKRVLVIGILLVAVAALVTGLSGTLAVLALARLLTGLAQGMYFANDRPIIAAATPPDRLALGQGVSFSGLGIGTALGVLVGGALGEIMPWRQVFLLLMVLPLCSAALIGRFVSDPRKPGRGASGAHTAGAAVAAVFRLRDLWLLGIAGISPIWTQWLVGTWGPALFAEVGVRELGRSALYASVLGIAAPPGLLAVGALSDQLLWRWGTPRRTVVAGGIAATALLAATMGWIVQAQGPPWLLALVMFATSFCFWGTWAPAYALTAELAPGGAMGAAFGVLNSVAFVSSLVAPYVTGWIKDWSGSFAGACYLAALVGVVAVPVALRVGSPQTGRGPATHRH
ncbi:MAG TPA: MFS transporter [Methylomirabilota bacterium]|jgi:MFS family permease|nr:MFS transporter [Methylomirabilota bacterium]